MERFRAEVLTGHKGAAAEVPFDPAERWALPARALWSGRRGHVVRGVLKGERFESAIVPRSRRFWLLLDAALLRATGVAVGDKVELALEPPLADQTPPKAPKRTIAKHATTRRKSARRR